MGINSSDSNVTTTNNKNESKENEAKKESDISTDEMESSSSDSDSNKLKIVPKLQTAGNKYEQELASHLDSINTQNNGLQSNINPNKECTTNSNNHNSNDTNNNITNDISIAFEPDLDLSTRDCADSSEMKQTSVIMIDENETKPSISNNATTSNSSTLKPNSNEKTHDIALESKEINTGAMTSINNYNTRPIIVSSTDTAVTNAINWSLLNSNNNSNSSNNKNINNYTSNNTTYGTTNRTVSDNEFEDLTFISNTNVINDEEVILNLKKAKLAKFIKEETIDERAVLAQELERIKHGYKVQLDFGNRVEAGEVDIPPESTRTDLDHDISRTNGTKTRTNASNSSESDSINYHYNNNYNNNNNDNSLNDIDYNTIGTRIDAIKEESEVINGAGIYSNFMQTVGASETISMESTDDNVDERTNVKFSLSDGLKL